MRGEHHACASSGREIDHSQFGYLVNDIGDADRTYDVVGKVPEFGLAEGTLRPILAFAIEGLLSILFSRFHLRITLDTSNRDRRSFLILARGLRLDGEVGCLLSIRGDFAHRTAR